MIGSGIASSLIHEVGHQAAAAFHDLVPTLKIALAKKDDEGTAVCSCLEVFERCISEIICDVWAMGHLRNLCNTGTNGRSYIYHQKYFQIQIS